MTEVHPDDPAVGVKTGWQAEGSVGQRKWHFIVGTESLCRKFGWYFGEVAEGGFKESDRADDCAECKRRVARHIAKNAAATGTSGATESAR